VSTNASRKIVLARKLREALHQRRADPFAAELIVHADLVDEQVRGVSVTTRQHVREHEADRRGVLEGREEERSLIGEELSLRLTLGELPHNVLVAEPKSTDIHVNAASRTLAGAFSQ